MARHSVGCDCSQCQEIQTAFDAAVAFALLCAGALAIMAGVRAGLFSWVRF